jgi:putative hydroxymethylpyrimidine transport system substrate-binding protein
MRKLFFIFLITLISVCHAEKMTVILDWFPNPDHAPLIVAQQQGFFQRQGLSVDLVPPADPSDPAKLVAAGKADLAIGYQPRFLEQVDQGLPLVAVGTLINQPLNALVVLGDSAVHSVADLKHTKIGYSGSGMNSTMLKIMLEQHGLSLQDVEIVQIHYNLTQALLSGKVDAVTGMMRNFEMSQLEAAGHPGRAFYPENNGMPTYSELIFIARQKSNAERIKRFFIALTEAVTYLREHPEETWQAYARAYPESNDEVNHRAWRATVLLFARNPGTLAQPQFMQFARFMQINGLIKSVPSPSTYFLAKD